MPEPMPVILEGTLTIDGVALDCLLSHIEISPDVSTVEVSTMCGTTEYPGRVKWLLKASLYQSFDVDGTEEVLSAAVAGGVPVPWTATAKRGEAVSATNPQWAGEAIPKPYPPIIGDAGDAMSIDIEWSTTEPVKTTTPVVAAAASSSTSSGSTSS